MQICEQKTCQSRGTERRISSRWKSPIKGRVWQMKEEWKSRKKVRNLIVKNAHRRWKAALEPGESSGAFNPL